MHWKEVQPIKLVSAFFHNLCTFAKNNSFFVVVACFTCTPDSIELVNWGTWHRCADSMAIAPPRPTLPLGSRSFGKSWLSVAVMVSTGVYLVFF